MAKTKELLMKELSSNKETNLQKFAVFQNRIFKKEAYVQALENLLKLTKKKANMDSRSEFERAELWVSVFELEDKLLSQKAILAQHIRYLKELKKRGRAKYRESELGRPENNEGRYTAPDLDTMKQYLKAEGLTESQAQNIISTLERHRREMEDDF